MQGEQTDIANSLTLVPATFIDVGDDVGQNVFQALTLSVAFAVVPYALGVCVVLAFYDACSMYTYINICCNEPLNRHQLHLRKLVQRSPIRRGRIIIQKRLT